MNDTPDLAADVDLYVKLRDKKKELQNETKEKTDMIDARLHELEMKFLKVMETTGLERIPTPSGTAWKSHKLSTSFQDWDATLDFIIEREAWPLLTKNLSTTIVREYLEEGIQIPGMNIKTWTNVNVTRK